MERVGWRGADTAPERLLVGARIEGRRLWPEHYRQNDIGDDRRRKEKDQPGHDHEPHDDRLDADIVGDAGADAGNDCAVSIAP